MKKFFAVLGLAFALAACGGQAAHAANIPDEYLCNGGTNVCSVVMQETVAPATAAQLTQLQALPSFAYFVQISGNFTTGIGTYANLSMATAVGCSSGTLTIGWFNGAAGYYSDPGCSIYNGIVARSQH